MYVRLSFVYTARFSHKEALTEYHTGVKCVATCHFRSSSSIINCIPLSPLVAMLTAAAAATRALAASSKLLVVRPVVLRSTAPLAVRFYESVTVRGCIIYLHFSCVCVLSCLSRDYFSLIHYTFILYHYYYLLLLISIPVVKRRKDRAAFMVRAERAFIMTIINVSIVRKCWHWRPMCSTFNKS